MRPGRRCSTISDSLKPEPHGNLLRSRLPRVADLQSCVRKLHTLLNRKHDEDRRGAVCDVLLTSSCLEKKVFAFLTRIDAMTDVSKNVKKAVDKTAAAARSATDKTADAAGRAAQKAGNALKNAGQKLKDAGT